MDALRGETFYLPPTTVRIIADIVAYTRNNELKVRAINALQFRATYPALCPPIPGEKGRCDAHLARLIIEEGLLDDTSIDVIRAQLLAECACLGVTDFFTFDPVLLRINQGKLDALVNRQELETFRISTVK